MLSKVFPESDLYVDQRLALLMPRCLAGFSMAIICTLMMLAMLYLSKILPSLWMALGLAGLVFLLYPLPLLVLYWQTKATAPKSAPRQIASNFFYGVLAIVLCWDVIAALILPLLSGSTRIIIICLYIGTVYAHFLPMAPFPKQSYTVVLVNLIPLSVLLMFQGDPDILPLGIAGVILSIKEISVILLINRMDSERFRWEDETLPTLAPDMSEEGFKRQRIDSIYSLGIHSLIAQIAVGFFIVIALRDTATDAMLWQWFALLVLLQTVRSIFHSLYHYSPERFGVIRWKWIAALNVLVSQLGWLLFMIQFHFNQPLVDIETAILIQAVVALISFVGLGTSRPLLYLNMICCLIVPILIAVNTFSPWLIAAMIVLTLLSVFIGLENLHQLSLRSLETIRLRLQAESRAEEMKTLNTELTQARTHLTEVNASLESQVKERTRELQYQAEHDMLTGLANRYRFVKLVEEALSIQQQSNTQFAVYMVDLNRFKEINDGLGHFAGDRVLQVTAHRLRSSCAPHHSCARWGGDEFVILQLAVDDQKDIESFSNQLLNSLRRPIELASGPVSIDASIGVSICPHHGLSANVLMEHADIAVYRAKCSDTQGADHHLAIYQSDWGEAAAQRLRLAQELRLAIESDQLEVALQPFITSQGGKLAGFEALARWRRADGSQVSPAEFIPLAEECGLMPTLGACILKKACKSLSNLEIKSDCRVAVNVSVSQLLDSEFHQTVLSTLQQENLPCSRLELEITENVFAGNVEHIRSVLAKLRDQGIRIAIDDFGTGYSSISYLQQFPVDTLKIDRSFVSALNDGGEALYSSIVSLAKSLGLHTIVEGVETKNELDAIAKLGGDEIQGYYFAKPMFLEEADLWARDYPEPNHRASH